MVRNTFSGGPQTRSKAPESSEVVALAAEPEDLSSTPGMTWWNKRTKLSSDLHKWAMALARGVGETLI